MGKILIAGSGRCGTTFLIQLLTLLGLPTGISFEAGCWLMMVYQHAKMNGQGMAMYVDRNAPEGFTPKGGMMNEVRAGLEYHVSYRDNILSLSKLPKIIKNPRFATMLEKLLAEKRIEVDHVFACVRDLHSVAKSKVESGKKHPRERYYQKSVDDIQRDSAEQLGMMTATLLTRDVPHSFVVFPRMIDDWEYLFDILKPIFPQLDKQVFKETHGKLAKKGFVNHRVVA